MISRGLSCHLKGLHCHFFGTVADRTYQIHGLGWDLSWEGSPSASTRRLLECAFIRFDYTCASTIHFRSRFLRSWIRTWYQDDLIRDYIMFISDDIRPALCEVILSSTAFTSSSNGAIAPSYTACPKAPSSKFVFLWSNSQWRHCPTTSPYRVPASLYIASVRRLAVLQSVRKFAFPRGIYRLFRASRGLQRLTQTFHSQNCS